MKLLQFEYDYPDSLEGFFEDILGLFTSQVPFEVIATLIFGSLAIASFIRSDSPIIPLGFIMLTGASVLPILAPIGGTIALFVIIAAGAGFITLAWYVYSE